MGRPGDIQQAGAALPRRYRITNRARGVYPVNGYFNQALEQAQPIAHQNVRSTKYYSDEEHEWELTCAAGS